MSAVLWSLPMLASGLLALLQYGFGSLFVVGESVAEALLRSTGADIAGTVQRLHASPLLNAAEAAAGLLLAAGCAGCVVRRPVPGALLAALSAGEAWWYGMPLITALLAPAAMCGIASARG
jgi:hypothetical protein